MKLSELPSHVQARIKRDNPGVFDAVRPVETHQPQPPVASALDRRRAQCPGRADCLAVRISFVVLLGRPMDSDNLIGSLKPLRDAVCESLGLDDADPRLAFEYTQIPTAGQEGVMVKVEVS